MYSNQNCRQNNYFFIIFQSTSSLESNLEGLASVLEADLTTYKAKILKILSECALKLPDKCTIYTTLIGLLNTKNYNFGGEVSSLGISIFGFGPDNTAALHISENIGIVTFIYSVLNY